MNYIKSNKFYSFFILLFFTNVIICQNSNLSIEEHKKELSIYQEWLDLLNLSEVIQVYDIEYQDDDTLTLYLQFAKDNIDFAVNSWNKLDSIYNLKETPDRNELGELLFFPMLHIFKTNPIKTKIEIYDTYDGMKIPALTIIIDYSKQLKSVKLESAFPKKQTKPVDIPIRKMNLGLIKFQPDEKMFKEKIFEKIYSKIEEIYSDSLGAIVEQENPGFHSDFMELNVTNIRQEILTTETDWICDIVRWFKPNSNCDLRRTEMLKFKISCQVNEKNIILQVELDARYGSGAKDNYDNWDKAYPMEPEFTYYLKKYTSNFATTIYKEFTEED